MTPLTESFGKDMYEIGLEHLQRHSKTHLYQILKGYTVNGQNPIRGYSRKTKEEILSEIQEHIDDFLRLNPPSNESKSYIDAVDQDGLQAEIITSLKSALIKCALDLPVKGLFSQAEKIKKIAASSYRKMLDFTESKATRSSLGSTVTRSMAAWLTTENNDDLNQVFGLFKLTWDSMLIGDRTAAKARTTALVKARRTEARILSDPLPLYAWVWAVLSHPEDLRWEVVSIALALATGRRQAEIHSTAVFEPVDGDEYRAVFSGQLKTKGGLGKSYEIPLLAPYDLVAKGMEFLESNDRRLHFEEWDGKATALLNKAFSMQLSNAVDVEKSIRLGQKQKTVEAMQLKNPIALMNYPLFQKFGSDYKKECKKDKFTYHNCRTIYANVCEILFNERQNGKGKMIEEDYLSTVLGHSDDPRAKKETSANYSIFDKDDFVSLTLEKFAGAVPMINGIEWLDSEVRNINHVDD